MKSCKTENKGLHWCHGKIDTKRRGYHADTLETRKSLGEGHHRTATRPQAALQYHILIGKGLGEKRLCRLQGLWQDP